MKRSRSSRLERARKRSRSKSSLPSVTRNIVDGSLTSNGSPSRKDLKVDEEREAIASTGSTHNTSGTEEASAIQVNSRNNQEEDYGSTSEKYTRLSSAVSTTIDEKEKIAKENITTINEKQKAESGGGAAETSVKQKTAITFEKDSTQCIADMKPQNGRDGKGEITNQGHINHTNKASYGKDLQSSSEKEKETKRDLTKSENVNGGGSDRSNHIVSSSGKKPSALIQQDEKELTKSGRKNAGEVAASSGSSKKYASIEDEKCTSSGEKISPTTQLDKPIISSGLVEFSLAPINSHLVCSACNGYYRDPYTTTCFHTFCKSCLFRGRPDSDGIYCPDCKTFLGADFTKIALFDRTLQEIVDKVVFPNLFEQDEENERIFYEKRGITLKPEFDKDKETEQQEQKRPSRRKSSSSTVEEVNFILKPADPCEMPALDRPCLQTQSSITVGQLKKFLMQKFPESVVSPSKVEILCNGVRLGKELSVMFVLRTVWLESNKDLLLTYQLAK